MRVALMIDADNLPPSVADDLLNLADGQGDLVVSRAYGDGAEACGWRQQPWIRFVETGGCSALRLGVEAAALAEQGYFDICLLASASSDLRHLASHLRAAGIAVVGAGGRHVPLDFATACDVFHTLGLSDMELPHPGPVRRPRVAGHDRRAGLHPGMMSTHAAQAEMRFC